MNNIENIETDKICHYPWTHLTLGWNKFSMCCVAPPQDYFGEIEGFSPNINIRRDVFNHKNYIDVREGFINGNIPTACLNCAVGAIISFKGFYSGWLKLIEQIENTAQKERIKENLEIVFNSLVSRETTVNHNPFLATITCGSACNIKCKFCYNCNMNYYPQVQDILTIIDQMHETLIEATLTGGEPIVTKAGRALFQEFASGKYKFFVQLFTNAQYADFSLYRPVNLRQVTISSDGATKKVYEAVRIGGNFEDLIGNVKKFIELKKEKPFMDIFINFTVTSDNYFDIPEAVKLYEGMMGGGG
jgi:hypothetical protein